MDLKVPKIHLSVKEEELADGISLQYVYSLVAYKVYENAIHKLIHDPRVKEIEDSINCSLFDLTDKGVYNQIKQKEIAEVVSFRNYYWLLKSHIKNTKITDEEWNKLSESEKLEISVIAENILETANFTSRISVRFILTLCALLEQWNKQKNGESIKKIKSLLDLISNIFFNKDNHIFKKRKLNISPKDLRRFCQELLLKTYNDKINRIVLTYDNIADVERFIAKMIRDNLCIKSTIQRTKKDNVIQIIDERYPLFLYNDYIFCERIEHHVIKHFYSNILLKNGSTINKNVAYCEECDKYYINSNLTCCAS